jgi:hypothetical protein
VPIARLRALSLPLIVAFDQASRVLPESPPLLRVSQGCRRTGQMQRAESRSQSSISKRTGYALVLKGFLPLAPSAATLHRARSPPQPLPKLPGIGGSPLRLKKPVLRAALFQN